MAKRRTVRRKSSSSSKRSTSRRSSSRKTTRRTRRKPIRISKSRKTGHIKGIRLIASEFFRVPRGGDHNIEIVAQIHIV